MSHTRLEDDPELAAQMRPALVEQLEAAYKEWEDALKDLTWVPMADLYLVEVELREAGRKVTMLREQVLECDAILRKRGRRTARG